MFYCIDASNTGLAGPGVSQLSNELQDAEPALTGA